MFNWIKSASIIVLSVLFIIIFSKLSLPLSVIPLTGQTFAIGVVSTALNVKQSFSAIVIYLILGIVGLPVFASDQSGLIVIMGPTGGYLISFLLYSYIVSSKLNKMNFNFSEAFYINILATLVTLCIGCIWLKINKSFSWSEALMHGFLPFLFGGALKAIAASFTGLIIHRLIKKFSLN